MRKRSRYQPLPLKAEIMKTKNIKWQKLIIPLTNSRTHELNSLTHSLFHIHQDVKQRTKWCNKTLCDYKDILRSKIMLNCCHWHFIFAIQNYTYLMKSHIELTLACDKRERDKDRYIEIKKNRRKRASTVESGYRLLTRAPLHYLPPLRGVRVKGTRPSLPVAVEFRLTTRKLLLPLDSNQQAPHWTPPAPHPPFRPAAQPPTWPARTTPFLPPFPPFLDVTQLSHSSKYKPTRV